MNQDGREIRFSQFHGKAIAVTFIYTRCPLPDFCIRMSTHFAALQKALENDPSMNGRWHLLSISFDAKFDRPAVLKRYAESYGADAAAWDFLTDPDTSGERVRRIADGLGCSMRTTRDSSCTTFGRSFSTARKTCESDEGK